VSSSYLPKPSDAMWRKTGSDEMMHRNVVSAVHGLVDYLRVERKRVASEVLVEAEKIGMPPLSRLRSALRRGEPPGI
jgi:hypothetical protein